MIWSTSNDSETAKAKQSKAVSEADFGRLCSPQRLHCSFETRRLNNCLLARFLLREGSIMTG